MLVALGTFLFVLAIMAPIGVWLASRPMTPGERLHAAIWPLAEATVDTALGDLSSEERRQLAALLTRVKSKLQALAEHDPEVNPGRDVDTTDQEARAL